MSSVSLNIKPAAVGSASKRIEVIDALRGFSLLGIILTHTTYSFLEVTAQPTSISEAGSLSLVDTAIKMGIQVFATGKFYSIFSFLFGLSFAIQLKNAKDKNVPFVGRFLWRLAILLIIGYLHTLLYPRDILQIYALLGTVLIFCINWSQKKLFLASGLLFIMSILATIFAPLIETVIFPVITEANKYAISDVFGVGKFAFLIPSGRIFVTVALFMLGLAAGRENIFKESEENRSFFRKLFWAGGSLAVISTAIVGLIEFTGSDSILVGEVVLAIFIGIQKIALSSFFVAVIVKLYRRRNIVSAAIHRLVPVGKIGLTIYVTQSLFIVGFYEVAFAPETINAIGLSLAMVITLAFFLGQLVFAHWWISAFRLGPLEWLWRSLTYMKMQPLRRTKDIQSKAEKERTASLSEAA